MKTNEAKKLIYAIKVLNEYVMQERLKELRARKNRANLVLIKTEKGK